MMNAQGAAESTGRINVADAFISAVVSGDIPILRPLTLGKIMEKLGYGKEDERVVWEGLSWLCYRDGIVANRSDVGWWVPLISGEDAIEVLERRAVIEEGIVKGLCATNKSPQDLGLIRNILEKMALLVGKSPDSVKRWESSNTYLELDCKLRIERVWLGRFLGSLDEMRGLSNKVLVFHASYPLSFEAMNEQYGCHKQIMKALEVGDEVDSLAGIRLELKKSIEGLRRN